MVHPPPPGLGGESWHQTEAEAKAARDEAYNASPLPTWQTLPYGATRYKTPGVDSGFAGEDPRCPANRFSNNARYYRSYSWSIRDTGIYDHYLYYFCQSGPMLCSEKYRIELELTGASNEVEPGGSLGLLAKVYDECKNEPVSGAAVKITLDVIPSSGGHNHHDEGGKRPRGGVTGADPVVGEIYAYQGATGGQGTPALDFSFRAPAIAGDHTVKVSCIDRECGQDQEQVWVGVKGLEPIPPGAAYELIKPNADHYHPDNHYLTIEARIMLTYLAAIYHVAFPNDPVLYLNDASLERGGLFDIKAISHQPWVTPHLTHRKGTEIDIRANPTKHPTTSVAEGNLAKFEKLAKEARMTLCPAIGPAYANSDNQHYHVCLTGGNCCQGGN